MDKAIEWFQQRQGRVSYSMDYRNGPNSYDCSSAVYHALIYAGILPQGFRIGNTETEFVDLPKFGFERIEADANGYIPTQRGDIFIWGKQGYTLGANGHTGIYLDSDNIIHCAYAYKGIHTDEHDKLAGWNNVQYLTIFRYTGKPQNAPAPAPQPEAIDDVINIGSHFKINPALQVAEVNINDGRRELKIDALCPRGFTWAENGIPANWAFKVDGDGYRVDGEINAGDWVKIQGAFVALEVVRNDGMWFARVNRDGIDVWMELTPVSEIPAGEYGTKTDYRPWKEVSVLTLDEPPTPESKPVPVEEPKTEVKEEKVVNSQELPTTEEKPTESQGLTVQEEEKKDMSHNLENSGNAENSKTAEKKQLIQINARPLTEEELKMLEDLQKNTVQNIANTEYEPRISEKAKTTVYFIADLGILTNMLIATICVILIPNYTKEILAISGAVATAFAGLKPIFKLGARK
nr:MAG TPA: peptidoglycan hydrolase [Caudoviricetes sp.]